MGIVIILAWSYCQVSTVSDPIHCSYCCLGMSSPSFDCWSQIAHTLLLIGRSCPWLPLSWLELLLDLMTWGHCQGSSHMTEHLQGSSWLSSFEKHLMIYFSYDSHLLGSDWQSNQVSWLACCRCWCIGALVRLRCCQVFFWRLSFGTFSSSFNILVHLCGHCEQECLRNWFEEFLSII